MSADPRSNEDIAAEALATADGRPARVLPRDRRKASAVLHALAAAGLHIVSEGEAVIDGQRGRLEPVTRDAWQITPNPKEVWARFVPSEPVSPGTDRLSEPDVFQLTDRRNWGPPPIPGTDRP